MRPPGRRGGSGGGGSALSLARNRGACGGIRVSNSYPLRRAALLILAAGLVAASGQGEVDLSGLVTDNNGAPVRDAKVMLLGRKLTALTGADGRYVLKTPSTALAGPVQTSLEVSAGALRLRVASPGSGTVTWFTLGGRALGSLPDGGVAPGQGAGALRKQAADPDTLSVVALGFARGERVVQAVIGTQDFRLGPLQWTQVQYKSGALNAAEKSACILDVRKPASGSRWPVVIHLHGGGLTGGDRNEAFGSQYNNFGQKFLDAGVMEVSPGYRLIGAGTWPDYIRDAAAAAIWVRKNIEPYGGDPNSVFVSGFSAGAYLTHMLAIDTTWFQEAKFDPRGFAGFISMSGQTRRHENLRQDLKVQDIMAEKPYAMPMGNLRKMDLPWQIFVGGDEGGTVTDNQALYNALISRGSSNLFFDVIPGQGHTCSDMGNATSVKRDKFLAFINRFKAR